MMVGKKAHVCLNCRYWEGDRRLQWREIEENVNCLDPEEGWPISGGCGRLTDRLNDGVDEISTPSIFGCVWFDRKGG